MHAQYRRREPLPSGLPSSWLQLIDFTGRLRSQAYAKALNKAGLLQDEEAAEIIAGLSSVAEEWAADKFEVSVVGHLLWA